MTTIAAEPGRERPVGPIRILELRSVRGTGGGPEKTILLSAAGADKERFAVTVCYIRDRRDDVFAIGERARQLGVDYVEVFESHSFDPRIWRQLRQLIRSREVDIVHAHEYKTDLLALMLARAERIVPLATAHAWTGHSLRERLFYYPADKRILVRYPRVIAVSSEIREELVRAGAAPGRVSVVLNGIDPALFRRDPRRVEQARASLGLSPNEFVIGSVGRLEPQKRFDLLVEAVAELLPRHPQLRLLIAGDGSLAAPLRSLIGRLGVEDKCRLLGHTGDVVGLHHALDLFVQSSEYEGTPNVVLEAMALETPIVATDAGGTKEVAEPDLHALIVPIRSREALSAAIGKALDDPASTAARVRAARERVEGPLSFAERTRAVERVYEELAHNRPRS
jgi:glycosyltransferase involved in cell wall biosynthesis